MLVDMFGVKNICVMPEKKKESFEHFVTFSCIKYVSCTKMCLLNLKHACWYVQC